MVMKPEPLVEAVEVAKSRLPAARVVLMGPRGRVFDQRIAHELHGIGSLVLICGHYEGVDERVLDYVDEELSLGDFILTGGELAALCVVDAVARLEPGVLGNIASACSESFEEGLLEHPQYTRPPEFRGKKVPEILLSGDHARVARWRRAMSLKATRDRRPDLFANHALSEHDRALLKELLEAEGESNAQQDP
jgi:tRNA (guanine37-N1)-methyltransferase